MVHWPFVALLTTISKYIQSVLRKAYTALFRATALKKRTFFSWYTRRSMRSEIVLRSMLTWTSHLHDWSPGRQFSLNMLRQSLRMRRPRPISIRMQGYWQIYFVILRGPISPSWRCQALLKQLNLTSLMWFTAWVLVNAVNVATRWQAVSSQHIQKLVQRI